MCDGWQSVPEGVAGDKRDAATSAPTPLAQSTVISRSGSLHPAGTGETASGGMIPSDANEVL